MPARRPTFIVQRQRKESHQSWTRRISEFKRELAVEAR